VYVYVCVCVCMCVFICMGVYVCVCVCICMYMSLSMCLCLSVCLTMSLSLSHCVCLSQWVFLSAYVCLSVSVCFCLSLRVCVPFSECFWFLACKKAIRSEGLPNLSKMEFDEQVAIALRNNDIGASKYVTSAAKSVRKELFDPLKKEAIDQGLLPKDVSVDTAASYFTRVWESKKIVANEPEFRDIVGTWVRQEAKESVRRFDSKFEKIQKGFRDEIDELKITAKREEALIRAEGKITESATKRIKKLNATAKKKASALEKKLSESEVEQRLDKEAIFDTETNFVDYADNVTDEIVQSLTQN